MLKNEGDYLSPSFSVGCVLELAVDDFTEHDYLDAVPTIKGIF